MTLAGIEPATFRIVAQHLNHCATAVPLSIHPLSNKCKALSISRPECLLFSELLPVSFVVMNMCFAAGRVELCYCQLFMKSDMFRNVLNS